MRDSSALFLLCGCLLCYTSGTLAQNTIEWENDAPKVKIKASGLFSKTPVPKLKNSLKAPPGTLAKVLAVDAYRFKWRPRWSFLGLGGAILPFVLESHDQSVLGIVETLPQKGAPASSIIVFMNLYNFDVINYLLMPGKNLRKFCFVPFSSNVVCLLKFPYDKYNPQPKFQLQTMNTHSGEMISSSPIFKDQLTALCSSADGSRLFVSIKNSNKARIYNLKKLSESFKTFKTVENPVAINRSANGKKLVIAGSGKIQIFNIEQQVLSEETINLPEFFHPEKLVLCSNDASTFLLSRVGGASYFYNGTKFIKLYKRSDNDINWSISEQRILIGAPKKSTIYIYDPQEPENPEAQFQFRKLKPFTIGKLYKIICLPDRGSGIGILDKRGALLRIYRIKRLWKKEVIINQPKPQ